MAPGKGRRNDNQSRLLAGNSPLLGLLPPRPAEACCSRLAKAGSMPIRAARQLATRSFWDRRRSGRQKFVVAARGPAENHEAAPAGRGCHGRLAKAGRTTIRAACWLATRHFRDLPLLLFGSMVDPLVLLLFSSMVISFPLLLFSAPSSCCSSAAWTLDKHPAALRQRGRLLPPAAPQQPGRLLPPAALRQPSELLNHAALRQESRIFHPAAHQQHNRLQASSTSSCLAPLSSPSPYDLPLFSSMVAAIFLLLLLSGALAPFILRLFNSVVDFPFHSAAVQQQDRLLLPACCSPYSCCSSAARSTLSFRCSSAAGPTPSSCCSLPAWSTPSPCCS